MCAGTHMLMEQSTEIREGELGSREHSTAGAMPLSSGGGPVLCGGWPGSRASTGGRKAGRLGDVVLGRSRSSVQITFISSVTK